MPKDETGHFEVLWVDAGRKAQNPADPAYPDGMAVDLAAGRQPSCTVRLQYPAQQVGRWVIVCGTCGWRGIVTAAGRADDPRQVVVPCKLGAVAMLH